MPSRLSRHDSYGRPLPHLLETPPQNLSTSEANVAQQDRIMRRLRATIEEHYPYLLRSNVFAEVTITFTVLRGTIQDDLYVGIVRQYRGEEE